MSPQGLVQHLSRKYFAVIIVTNYSPLPLNPDIKEAADEIHIVPMHQRAVRNKLVELHLDVLIFADTMSEPQNWLLSHMRMAPVQIAFWGNPVTSGALDA